MILIRHTDIEPEFKRIKNNNGHSQTVQTNYTHILTNGYLMKPLFVSMGIMFFQQFSGINAIIFYSASIFQEAGSTIDRFISSIMIGVVQLVFTGISALVVCSNGSVNLEFEVVDKNLVDILFRWTNLEDGLF